MALEKWDPLWKTKVWLLTKLGMAGSGRKERGMCVYLGADVLGCHTSCVRRGSISHLLG